MMTARFRFDVLDFGGFANWSDNCALNAHFSAELPTA